MSAVDPVYFESAYYLGPDEGGEKPYRLLAIALAKTQRAAVAKLVSRGKEQIVMIRPYRGGLVLPTLGKGLLSECPATSLNRKNTAASTACESWRWSMQKSKAAKSSPRSSPQVGAGHRPHGLKQSMRKVHEKKVASARKVRKIA